MNNRIVVLSALLLFIPQIHLFAQVDEEINNHIIIAIDERINGWEPGDNAIRRMVEKYLFEPITIKEDSIHKTLYGGKPLYQTGDFLSIVTFSLGQKDKSIDSFASIASYEGKEYKFVPYSDAVKNTIHTKWEKLVQKRVLNEKRHSIFSIAIPQVMAECARDEAYQLTNRTFVIMITDRAYSDKTYFDDIRDFTDLQHKTIGWHYIKKSDIIGISQAVSKEFFINWINQDERKYQFWQRGYHIRTKNTDLYEIQPLQEHLRMHAVLEYPTQITAKRGKWGEYSIKCDLIPEDSIHFNVLRLEATMQGEEKTPVLSYTSDSPDSSFSGITLCRKIGSKKDAYSQINLRIWVNLKDGTYNATVLSPSFKGESYLGRDGLNVTIPIVYEDTEKVAFFFPLWDILCLSENQEINAILINILIFILIIGCLALYIHLTKYYKPSIDEIQITYRNRN